MNKLSNNSQKKHKIAFSQQSTHMRTIVLFLGHRIHAMNSMDGFRLCFCEGVSFYIFFFFAFSLGVILAIVFKDANHLQNV